MDEYNENDYNKLLDEFVQFLIVQKDRDLATAKAYLFDVKIYTEYFRKKISADLTGFTVDSEKIIGFLSYLKNYKTKIGNPLAKSTIKRRLIGVYNFWKFLFRIKRTLQPPVSLDDLDIIVKKTTNPTKPLDTNAFITLREELKNELTLLN